MHGGITYVHMTMESVLCEKGSEKFPFAYWDGHHKQGKEDVLFPKPVECKTTQSYTKQESCVMLKQVNISFPP